MFRNTPLNLPSRGDYKNQTMETKDKDLLRGGQFLVKETSCEDVFTPEDFSEEQKNDERGFDGIQ